LGKWAEKDEMAVLADAKQKPAPTHCPCALTRTLAKLPTAALNVP